MRMAPLGLWTIPERRTRRRRSARPAWWTWGRMSISPARPSGCMCRKGAAGGDGLSQATAFATLQDALKLAQADPNVTEIWVGSGVYRPDRDAAFPAGTGDRSATFLVPGAVRIYGGFPAGAAPIGTSQIVIPLQTRAILSGDLAGNDGPNFANNGENSYHVVDASWTTTATMFDGLTSQAATPMGQARPLTAAGYTLPPADRPSTDAPSHRTRLAAAAGLYNASSGSPVLTSCRFEGNRAASGGGMWNASSTASIVSCIFSGNSATSSGGGLFNYGSSDQAGERRIQREHGALGRRGLQLTAAARRWSTARSSGMRPRAPAAASRAAGHADLTNCIVWGNTAPAGHRSTGPRQRPTAACRAGRPDRATPASIRCL